MPRKASFKFTSTPRGWKVELPARISPSGKRERVYFKTREKAKEYATKLRDDRDTHGSNATNIRPALAEEASRASAMLERFGISLIEAARRIVEIEDAKAASENVTKALAAFLLVKEGKSGSQQRTYDQMRAPFEQEFGDRQLSTITEAELVTHVESNTGKDSTYNRRAEAIRAFWRWSARTPRNWCNEKLVEALERRDLRKGVIGVLTAEQCEVLMKTAEQHYPECVPAFAICLFTGMRKAELDRLEPDDITSDGITVSAASSKTNRRRFIEMPAPLAAWLKAYPVADTVLPANWSRKEAANVLSRSGR